MRVTRLAATIGRGGCATSACWPKDVQEILRHSKVSTTMDLYVHSYDEDLRAAVGKLGAAIG